MLCFKKNYIVLGLLSFNGFAGTLGDINALSPQTWGFGGQALYLKPTSSASVPPQFTVTDALGNHLTAGANPDWGWGFQLEGSYKFSAHRDLNLNWYHFSNSTSNVSPAASGVNLDIGDLISSISSLLDSFSTPGIYASNQVYWDQVNLEFGRITDSFENIVARFHAGLNFSRVRIGGDSSATYTFEGAGLPEDTANLYYKASDSYNGFGPRVGTDLSYNFGNGIEIYADAAVSVLAGSAKSSIYRQVYSTLLSQNYVGTIGYNKTNVVGELDARLETRYTYSMVQGDLSADFGWLFSNYMNAFSVERDRENSFGIQGLYFGLRWVS